MIDHIRAVTNILANLLLRSDDPPKAPYEELDHLVRCVDALSIGAITVLGAAREVAATKPISPQQEIFQFAQLRSKLAMDPAFFMSLVSELRELNLMRVQETPLRPQGDAEYDGFHMNLTSVGEKLIERFIEGRM